MKLRLWILPLVAGVAAVWLLGSQSAALSSVREEVARLRRQVDAAGQAFPGPLPTGSTSSSRSSAKSVNWLRLAEITGEGGADGIFARQELLRAKMRLQTMTADELLASLAAIKELGLDARSRREVDAMLVTALAEKDPAAALNYIRTPANDRLGLLGGTMHSILAAWTKSDLPAALAWFDGQIASGAFDSKSLTGKNQSRFNIEAILLASLSASDPAAAAVRLSAYPPADRITLFRLLSQFDHGATASTDENELASRVALARSGLPATEQAAFVSNSISAFSKTGDYEAIDRFLDRVDATPEERAASIPAAARERFASLASSDQLTVREIDRFRKWVTTRASGKTDELTGRALATISFNPGNGFDPTELLDGLVSHYQDSSGNDAVLIGFLEGGGFWGDKAKASLFIEKIHDPDQRARYFEKLAANPLAR